MATIRKIKLKSGETVYRATVYKGVNPGTGKKIYTTLSDKSSRELQAQIDKVAVDRREQTGTPTNDHITFFELYQEWLAAYKGDVKPSTYEIVQSKFKANIIPNLGYYQVKKITPKICQRFINKLVNEPKTKSKYSHGTDSKYRLSRGTVRELRTYCNSIFKFALKRRIIATNPMEYIDIPKRDNDFMFEESDRQEKRKYWLKSEVEEFLQLAQNELQFQDFVMFRTVLFSGMRKGEVQALHWKDINFQTGEVWVGKTLVQIRGKFSLQKTKNGIIRTIVLDRKTLNYLQQWYRKENEFLLASGAMRKWHNDPACFISGEGTYLPLSHLNNIMNYNFYLHHPDFYRITVHQMRHTHASLMFESGANLKEVQEKLGHKNIQTTMNIYTHVTKTKRGKIQEKFANFMNF